jgi:uncharacterized delta-60 repeat protein
MLFGSRWNLARLGGVLLARPWRALPWGLPLAVVCAVAQVAVATSYASRTTTPDPEFGKEGVVIAQPVPGVPNAATSIALSRDGDLLVGGVVGTGQAGASGSSVGFVVRLLPSGRFDSSFGHSGVVTLLTPSSITQIAAEPEGHILVLDGSLIGLDDDGASDTSFGVGGVAALPTAFAAQQFVIQSNGDIVLIGTVTRPDGSSAAAVARLTSAGQPDPSFGTDGLVVLPMPVNRSDIPLTSLSPGGLVVQPNGDVVLTVRGEPATSSPAPSWPESVLERVTADGTLDTSFGQNGQVRIGLGETVGTFDPQITNDGNILVPIMVGSGVLGQGPAIDVISPEGHELNPWREKYLEYQSVGAFVALPDGAYLLLYSLYGYTGSPQLTLSGANVSATGSELGFTPAPGPVMLPDDASDPHSLLLAQPDGKLIMAGTAPGANGEQALFVTRLLGISSPAIAELPRQRIHRSARAVTLRLVCSRAQACNGDARLYLKAHGRQARIALGSRYFSMGAGHSRNVVIRLTHDGRLSLSGPAATRVTLTLALADGPTRSAMIIVPGVH